MIVYSLSYNKTIALQYKNNTETHILSKSVILSSAKLFEQMSNLNETYSHYYDH